METRAMTFWFYLRHTYGLSILSMQNCTVGNKN